MLITLEGIDGAGKSTLYEGLKTRLLDLEPVFTKEPGSPLVNGAVRREIKANRDPFAEATLFVADHAAHLTQIVLPALENKKLVISDRYADSRFAYQQVSLEGIVPDPKAWLTAVHAGWSVRPDLTILLLIAPETAMIRLAGREGKEHFENPAFLEEVQKKYLERVAEDPERFLLIDAVQEPETILDFVEKSIRALPRT
ncbi:MAG: putative thymidylate kinase [Methanocorpusculum sp. MCE]|nr:MAG: putative thymidylate kinase [Methanocorpusculum sp. MCE]